MSIRDISSRKQIPDAKFYVLSDDVFFSNWFGNGKKNTIILPCKDLEQVDKVMAYARSRTDQQRIRWVIHKPRLREGVIYSLLTPENASSWYE